MSTKSISQIIDKYLNRLIKVGLNCWPIDVEDEMKTQPEEKGFDMDYWKPIPSSVTENDLISLEKQIGYPLPSSYKDFLQYKHFYELVIDQCSIYSHPIRHWKNNILEEIFNGYPREELIDKGLIPFANWSDWSLVCFDTNTSNNDNNYPVIIWDDRQSPKTFLIAEDFESFIIQLEEGDLSIEPNQKLF